MANEGVSLSEVKSIVNSLECSPSKNDSDGAGAGGKPSIAVTGEATSSKEKTGPFTMSRSSGKVPGYKSKFARGARQE